MSKIVSIVLAFTLVFTCALAAATRLEDLLPNGNFEQPPKSTDVKKTVLLYKNALPKWEASGLVEYIHGGPQPGGMYFPVAHGVHAIK
ncbi:galactose-binding domain-like protein, partial [Tanacetum coccineum]